MAEIHQPCSLRSCVPVQTRFQKHYLPDLFTPEKLVKLFKKLLIFADFPDKQLFMPALLRVLGDNELPKFHAPSDSPAAPLALDFPLGGPRLGVFCALSCFLISRCSWEIEVDARNNPVCLHRNCIQFSIPDYPCSITLMDTFSHFQVHVDVESDWCQDVCSAVRGAILSGLNSVNVTLGYTDCPPSRGVVCPCGIGEAHAAKILKQSWVCQENRRRNGKSAPRYLVWEDNACQPKGGS